MSKKESHYAIFYGQNLCNFIPQKSLRALLGYDMNLLADINLDIMLVVIGECGNDVAVDRLAVDDEGYLLAAVVGILNVQLVASEITGRGNRLPSFGECGIDVETVVVAVKTENTLVAAHQTPSGGTGLPSEAHHHIHGFVL